MEEKRFFCHDHFERVVKGRLCEHCPDHINNTLMDNAIKNAIINEIKNLQKSVDDNSNQLTKLSHKILGNGQEGISDRLIKVEQAIGLSKDNVKLNLVIVSVIITTILSLVGLIMK